MEFTVQNFVKSGAVRHLCHYADSECGNPIDWNRVTEYARREFRDATEQQIADLIETCKHSHQLAEFINNERE